MSSSASSAFKFLGGAAFVAAVGIVGVPAAIAADAAAPGPSIDVTGFVDTYYSYNFNKPPGKVNQLHSYDVDHNSLSLSLVELALEKKPTTDSRVGFRIDTAFGPTAEINNAFEPSSADSLKLLQQGYVSFLAGDKIQIDAGKMNTFIGAEVIESKDNWNYTRSLQFGWAIPFYHAGVRATLTPSDKFVLAGYLVNGWNNVVDNNNDKSFGAQAILKPSGKFTLIGNAIVGKEADETRSLFDAIVTLSPSDKFSLMANYDHGKDGDAQWDAISGYAKLTAGKIGFSPRVEWVNDDDAFLTGTSQKLTSFTLTTEFKIGGGVLTRVDLRQDHSNVSFFESDSGFKKNQTGLTVGVVYAFGGKI